MIGKKELLGLIRSSGVSPSVVKAFEKTDRADFVPAYLQGGAYEDRPISLPEGQTTSQPSLIALIVEKLELRKGQKALEVGSGFGFQTALLSELVGARGLVVSIEFVKTLFEEAKARLSKRKNVLLLHGDGKKGFPSKAPFDAIVVSAACSSFPKTLFEQLKKGGRMVYPHQSSAFGGQDLLLVTKTLDGKPLVSTLLPVAFVPLR